LAWEYAVGGGPFCLATCGDADRLLLDRLQEIVTRLKGFSIARTAGSGDQITDGMRVTRGSSLADRRQIYLRDRIDDQRTWYSQKAEWNGSRYRVWLVGSLLAQASGLVFGFLLAFGVIAFDGLGVLAAVAAAIAAWVQAKDHASLAQAYGIAAQELGFAKSRLESQASQDEEVFAALVDDAEQAISREHTLWLARRGSASSPG
jgi:hypothetical protein